MNCEVVDRNGNICGRPIKRRKYCHTHYIRFLNGLSLLEPIQYRRSINMSDPEFVVWIQSQLKENNGCLEWTGKTNGFGYGHVHYGDKMVRVHRLLYIITYDLELTEEDFVLHKCHNRLCCNIDHLYLGDHKMNMEDLLFRCNSSKFKLNQQQVEEIRNSTKPPNELMLIYGIGETAISNIRRNKKWKREVIERVNSRSIAIAS